VNETINYVDKLTAFDMYLPILNIFTATVFFYYANKNYLKNKSNIVIGVSKEEKRDS
jgi:hypothetical protein